MLFKTFPEIQRCLILFIGALSVAVVDQPVLFPYFWLRRKSITGLEQIFGFQEFIRAKDLRSTHSRLLLPPTKTLAAHE